MSDLVIRGDALHAHARHARRVAGDLTAAPSQAGTAADAVGHHGLARTVRDFASQWGLHRDRLVREITALADICDAINATIADLDGDMATQLREATTQSRGHSVDRPAGSGTPQ